MIVQAFRDELIRQDKSPITIRNYVNDVELFSRWIAETYGDFHPARIVQRDVVEYRSFLLANKGASPATVNRRLASLAKFFSWCRTINDYKIEQNPVEGVHSIKLSDPGARSLDSRDLRKLLREVEIHQNLRDICVIQILCQTAIRARELTEAFVSDVVISERKGSIRIRSGKGRTFREVPLNAEVRKAISRWLDIRPATTSNHLIVGQRGEKMTPSGIWRIVKKYAEICGLTDVQVHDLRRTALTRLLRECQCDIATVARISGHRNLNTLKRYVEPTREDLQAAVEKLAFVSE